MEEAFRIDYAANGGDTEVNHNDGPTSLSAGDTTFSFGTGVSNTGIVFVHRVFRMKQLIDGTSKTYMVGEKYLNTDYYENGLSVGDNQNIYSGDDKDGMRWTAEAPNQDTPGAEFDSIFGSAHAGAFNIAFCDGSVQSVNYLIDLQLHRSLGNRKDGKPSDISGL